MKTRVKKQIDISFMDAGYNHFDDEAIPADTEIIEDANETRFKPESKAIKLKDKKIRLLEKKKVRIKTFADTIKELPAPGERLFIIGGGNIDAIHSIHVALDFIPRIEEMYIATWSLTGDNIKDLFQMFDQKKIKRMSILVSFTFKRLRKWECPLLTGGMNKRGQKVVICKNHSKIILMKAPGYHLIVDGSANFTVNPRIEQVNFTNSEELYNFNKAWMDSVLMKVYPEMKNRRKT